MYQECGSPAPIILEWSWEGEQVRGAEFAGLVGGGGDSEFLKIGEAEVVADEVAFVIIVVDVEAGLGGVGDADARGLIACGPRLPRCWLVVQTWMAVWPSWLCLLVVHQQMEGGLVCHYTLWLDTYGQQKDVVPLIEQSP